MPRRARQTPATSTGAVLRLIRDGAASTRADVARLTGLSRSAVSLRLDELSRRGLIVERSTGPSTGGRPPGRIEFNAAGGVVLVASLGASRARLAVCDLAANIVLDAAADLAVGAGPDAVLPALLDRFDELLAKTGYDRSAVRGVGLAVPGTVEFAAGRTVRPPIMPAWDGVVIAPYVRERLPVPVYVDNDVNVMALGEHSSVYRGRVEDLLFVKISTGIGAGVVAGGRIQRGALGAAGDIGHVRVTDAADVTCRCGNTGCVEALASGTALVGQLAALGLPVSRVSDVVDLVRAGHPEAGRLVRAAGRRLGEVLAAAVNLLNPAVIVIGGDLALADEQLFPGVREIVYQRSTALATRELLIVPSRLDERAGVVGCAVLVLEEILAPGAVDAGGA